VFIPVSDQLGELGMTVPSQELNRVRRHGWQIVWSR
jgi:hypothetical protein